MGEREKQYKGNISYKKLFDLMAEKGITWDDITKELADR